MAEPTPVNGQITDAVTQSNVKVVAEAPAMALASLYQAAAQAQTLAMQNAVTAQQQGNVLAQAAAAAGVAHLMSTGGAGDLVFGPGDLEDMDFEDGVGLDFDEEDFFDREDH